MSILLAVFDKYSPYSYQNSKESWDGQGDEPRIFTLKEGLWFCMTSLTPQGGGEAPRALSGRYDKVYENYGICWPDDRRFKDCLYFRFYKLSSKDSYLEIIPHSCYFSNHINMMKFHELSFSLYRLVAATWWMFGFIMIATYTANLAAFLTVSNLEMMLISNLVKTFRSNFDL